MTFSQVAAGDLRTTRLERSLPLRDVAERAGVDLQDLKRWERGLEVPADRAIRKLAKVFSVDPISLAEAQRRYVTVVTPGEGYTTAVSEDRSGHICMDRFRMPETDQIRVLDLFCGSGGFSSGFEQTGDFAVTTGIDLLADRIGTFRRNHHFANNIIGDIRTYPLNQLGDQALGPDVVIGGPPCQGFSSIRPFRMCTPGDPRNNLFEHFALVVERLRPKWFVMENVVGLLTHGGGAILPQLLASFEQAGYKADWRIINAAQYGLPQNRERLIVVGNREGRSFEWPAATNQVEHRSMAGSRAKRMYVDPLFNQSLQPPVTVMQAIHDLPALGSGESAEHYLDDVIPTAYERMMRGSEDVLTLHQSTAHSEKMLNIIRQAGTNRAALPAGLTSSGFSSCYSRLSGDEPSVTITVNFVHPSSNKCIHPVQDRALTPREGARLQGFPDSFRFEGSRSQVVKQIGNAVPPLLGKVIANAIRSQF